MLAHCCSCSTTQHWTQLTPPRTSGQRRRVSELFTVIIILFLGKLAVLWWRKTCLSEISLQLQQSQNYSDWTT